MSDRDFVTMPAENRTVRVLAFWALLAAPAVLLLAGGFVDLISGGFVFYWSGAISVALVLLALAATPARRIFRGQPWPRWLIRNRRYLGVASFGYAVVHLLLWLRGVTRESFLESFVEFAILVGWISFLIYVLLTLTSNDYSVRRLGPWWKHLHWWVYPATVLALLHWFLVYSLFSDPVNVVLFGLFLFLVVVRIFVSFPRKTRDG